MIYLELFWGFLKVGCFAFGGGYGAIPLIREVVTAYGWLDDEALSYMIAVSESTPGPIMVNLATYAGCTQAGLLGGLVATVAVVLPAFFITILVTALLKTLLEKPWMQAILGGMRSAVNGISLATGLTLISGGCVFSAAGADWRALVTTGILLAAAFGLPRFGKKLSPMMLIALSAVIGIVIYGG